jgi:hypothetical protein
MGLSLNPAAEGTYWVVGPDYLQARPEFQYLYDIFEKNDLIVSSSMPISPHQPWAMETKMGHKFFTRSSSDISKLASFVVHGAIISEAAQQEQEVWEKMMGRVSETRGFVILSGTLEKGLPWYPDLYRRWQGENVLQARSWSLPSWSNTVIYPEGRDDPAIKELESEYSPDKFMERFGAEPRKLSGLVIPEFDIATHVKALTPDPKRPVELWMDPGQHTYAVLFVQNVGLETFVLDRVYVHNRIAQEVIPEVMGNSLFKLVDKRNAGVIDTAGKQRHANKSQVELWMELAQCNLRTNYILLEDTIETVRYRLGSQNPLFRPLVYFNSHMTTARTPDGLALDVLAEFELWKWREMGDQRGTPRKPIDKNNDAIKALGYGLVDVYGKVLRKQQEFQAVQRSYFGMPVR